MSGSVLPVLGRFSVEKQESLLKLSILSISAVLAFSTRLFSVLRYTGHGPDHRIWSDQVEGVETMKIVSLDLF